MCKALNDLMKDELEARETRGANKLKEAVLAIKNGVKAAEIKKKYGKDIFDAANDLVKSFA